MEKKSEARNIKLPTELWKKLLKLAEKDNRKVGNYICTVLLKHVDAENKQQ